MYNVCVCIYICIMYNVCIYMYIYMYNVYIYICIYILNLRRRYIFLIYHFLLLSYRQVLCMFIQFPVILSKSNRTMSHIICSFTQHATCAAPCRCWLSSEPSRRDLPYSLAQIVPMYRLTLPASFSRCRRRYGNRCWLTWTTAWWQCCHLNWRPRQTFSATSWRNGTSD